ncbi:MAG: hypothetical protein L6R37_002414 [Teloschistes peruensis]|nr:MAG: hypothetical protein L6R37_002414 [Teloschistes peruensis]
MSFADLSFLVHPIPGSIRTTSFTVLQDLAAKKDIKHNQTSSKRPIVPILNGNMGTLNSAGKFWSPRSGSEYKSWLDTQLVLRMPQRDVANDWQQSADSSLVDQTHEAKLRRLSRLHTAVVALKDNIKRSAARIYQNHDQEEQDSWDYDANSQMSSWKNPRDAVSLFSAKTRDIKNRLKSWTRIKKDSTSFQPDSNWETDNWETDSWETDNWETESWNPATTLEAHPGFYERLTPKLLDFIAPLQESSSPSKSSQEKSFLRQFLSERRYVKIHPERKHRLAMFLHRICEEASFAYLAMQEPLALSILRVHTADQIEFSVWIILIGNIRRLNKSLGDGLSWPNPLHRTDTIENNSDNVYRLRNVVVHRWDYSSKLIEDVVAYLERLHDTDRRAQVEDALEELYHDECARKSNQDVLLSSEQTVGHDQVSTGRPSTEGKGSSDGSTTLRNDGSCDDASSTKLGSTSDEASTSRQESFLDDISCTPKIAMPSSVPTYQQLLRSSQDILEKSLFKFAREEFPAALIRYGYTTASEVELQQYSWQFDRDIIHALPDLGREEVFDIISAGARSFRNASAHHQEYQKDLEDPEDVHAGWGDDNQQAAEALMAIEDTKDRNKQLLSGAQALAQMINDDGAVRQLQMLSWAADINIRAANEKIQDEESRRSLEEWECLEKAAAALMRDFDSPGQFSNGWHDWLYLRLEGNCRYFRDQARKLRG